MKFSEAMGVIRQELIATGKAGWQIERVLTLAGETFLRQSCVVPESEIASKGLDNFDFELSDYEITRIRDSAMICLLAMR